MTCCPASVRPSLPPSICSLWWHTFRRLELESPYVVHRHLGCLALTHSWIWSQRSTLWKGEVYFSNVFLWEQDMPNIEWLLIPRSLAQLMSCKLKLSLCDDLLSGVCQSIPPSFRKLWWHKSRRLELESPYLVCRHLGWLTLTHYWNRSQRPTLQIL